MSTTITYIRHKKLDTKLRDESFLQLALEQLASVEPPSSMLYIEPNFNTTYANVMALVNAANNRQRKGMMMKSFFKVESEIGKSIKVLKVRNEKEGLLLCEFTFSKTSETATGGAELSRGTVKEQQTLPQPSRSSAIFSLPETATGGEGQNFQPCTLK